MWRSFRHANYSLHWASLFQWPLLATFGQSFPVVTSDPAAINRAALSAKLKAASDSLSISDGQLILDDSRMKLSFRAANFAEPDVAFDFIVDPKAVGTIKGQGDEKARAGILVPIIVSGTFSAPKFRPDIKRIIRQQVDKGVLDSEPAKKIFEKKEMKKFEEPAKQLLKDLIKKP
jgi:AsmA protein